MEDDLIAALLGSLVGVVGVRRIPLDVLREIVAIEIEARMNSAVCPRAAGMEAAAMRDTAYALLKDSKFRAPPGPTVYLVEEIGSIDPVDGQVIEVEGMRYHVLGEEVMSPGAPLGDDAVLMTDAFVLFPARRLGTDLPAYFLIPPLPFVELDEKKAELGISAPLSVSPTAIADKRLREILGFPDDPTLATIVVAFDRLKPDR